MVIAPKVGHEILNGNGAPYHLDSAKFRHTKGGITCEEQNHGSL